MPPPLIVVVDDEQAVLDMISLALTYEGYRVLQCRTVAEAIATITREQPALVILDLWIELTAGAWDVSAALARDPSTAAIPIIVCTGADAGRRQQPAHIQPQYLAFLGKPFSITDLESAVETALASRQDHSQLSHPS
jgi:CheY-like chemotaxis protein